MSKFFQSASRAHSRRQAAHQSKQHLLKLVRSLFTKRKSVMTRGFYGIEPCQKATIEAGGRRPTSSSTPASEVITFNS
jgi:hypothetical protein